MKVQQVELDQLVVQDQQVAEVNQQVAEVVQQVVVEKDVGLWWVVEVEVGENMEVQVEVEVVMMEVVKMATVES